MASLNKETLRSGTEWFPVDDSTAIGSARRAAMRLAARLGFDEHRVGETGIVASEVSTNLFRHASSGVMGLQVALRSGEPGVQVVAVDRGPGMTDFSALSLDGASTSKTLGLGLGAVARLSCSLDVSSQPGIGTVMVATLWPDRAAGGDGIDIGGITRPLRGEEVCGDAVAARQTGGRQVLMIADGLGHGALAEAASQAAVNALFATAETEPALLMATMHDQLAHTRGAAAFVASVDADFRRLRVTGVGNISGFIVRGGTRRPLMSHPGVVGHQSLTIRQLDYDIGDDDIIILHSDGLTERWNLDAVPGLSRRSSTVIAASLLRDAGTRRDDASLLVLRRRR